MINHEKYWTRLPNSRRTLEKDRASTATTKTKDKIRKAHKQKRIDWEWQSMDGAMTKAPLGGEGTGANPTDRGKKGTKRSLQTDGNGIPISVVVAGANCHDKKLAKETLDGIMIERPDPKEVKQNMCMDKGYDYPDI